MLLGLLMAFVCLTANAQFEADKMYLNASFSGLNLAYSKNTRFTADIQATAGYFFLDDWMVLGRVGYNHPGRKMDNFELGVGSRYYIEQNGLSLGAFFSYEHVHNGVLNDDHCYFSPEIAYTFFLNRNLTLEPAIYYKMSLDNFSDASTAGLKIGFGFYF